MTAFPTKTPKPTAAEPTEPAAARATASDILVSEAFYRDLETARKALASLLSRLRHLRGKPVALGAGPTVPSVDVVARLQLSLKKEHDLVLVPLLDRLDNFAVLLDQGSDVPIPILDEGLGLIDRYLHELHDVHLRLLEIAGADPAKGEPARLAFQQLASDFEHARVRWATVRVMMRGYEEGIPRARAILGLTLAQECRAERAWHDFEEEYVRASLPPAFSPKVAETWRVELDHTREAGRADRTRIEEWVARTNEYATRHA